MQNKMHDLVLTEHEISLIHTSLSNFQRDIANRFRYLKEATEEGDEVWIGDYDKIQLNAIDSIQKKLLEI